MGAYTQKTFVYVTFQKEGYHCFPAAATETNFATGDEYDVSHLAHRHMHYFYFKVWVEVNHDDREIEFIQMRRWIENQYNNDSLELNNKSCEMIAEELYHKLVSKYGGEREIRIDVSEDNINGAYVEYKAI